MLFLPQTFENILCLWNIKFFIFIIRTFYEDMIVLKCVDVSFVLNVHSCQFQDFVMLRLGSAYYFGYSAVVSRIAKTLSCLCLSGVVLKATQ